MCDTVCAITAEGAIFAKNSDRPVEEVQLIEAHPARPPGGMLTTQYLGIEDEGARATMIARPDWMWGAEHGVNDRGLAIGNEKIYTAVDPYALPPALTGMDLVRLALERADDANMALEVLGNLLERHGQGGVADATHNEPYFSSFLICDATRGWVLETAGSTWAAKEVESSAAISNRMTISRDWQRASEDVPKGADFDTWRNPEAPTGHADNRLSASCAFLERKPSDPRSFAAHMRDHGSGPWGAPGSTERPERPPDTVLPDGTGVTICMHVPSYQATASSMVAWLPADPELALRAWVAPGSPCVSLFIPVFPPDAVAVELRDPEIWRGFKHLRDRVENDPEAIESIRQVIDPVEARLWDEADSIADSPFKWEAFEIRAGGELKAILERLDQQ